MNKIDYNEIMLRTLAEARRVKGGSLRILLHCCCAPCACYPVELLKENGELTLYYCNPNITDMAEYEKRLSELKRLGAVYGLETADCGYDGESFYTYAGERGSAREGGAACALCIDKRLELTAEYREAEGYDLFATTLTVSPLKNANVINGLGSKYGGYLPSDFKKRDGYRKGTAISNSYGFYRQNYCGCEFSRHEAELRGLEKEANKENYEQFRLR